MNRIKDLFLVLVLSALVFSCTTEELSPGQTVESLQPSDDLEFADFLVLDEHLTVSEEELIKELNLENEKGQLEKTRYYGRSTIYTLSNEASGNEVISFNSNSDGTIYESGRFATGGTGTDAGLGNQGALVLSPGKRLLYAVNPGSDEISFFFVFRNGRLFLLDKIHSGGQRPISITFYRGLIYVLNAGSDNIAGFTHNRYGKLVAIPHSIRSLSATGTDAAQISFSPNGRALVVTERATNTISSFKMNSDGRPGVIQTQASAGMVPFGFSFGKNNTFHVSEAGGVGNGSTASTYRINNQGRVSLVDGPLELNTAGACWVVVTNDNKTVFVMNTATDNISSLSVSPNGNLGFANGGNTTPAEDGPLDAGLDRSSRYLYVLAGGTDGIVSFRVGPDGQLTQIDLDTGLPDRATGIVVR